MTTFTGKSINMSIQQALEDALRQAVQHKAEGEHALVKSFEVVRIYGVRTDQNAFRTLHVDIDAN